MGDRLGHGGKNELRLVRPETRPLVVTKVWGPIVLRCRREIICLFSVCVDLDLSMCVVITISNRCIEGSHIQNVQGLGTLAVV